MLHLSSERLAALADSEPTPLEADHLAVCAACARDRAATRSLLMMARAEREQLGMPLTRWDSLAPELHRAGLVTAGALMSAPPAPPDFERAAPAGAARRGARWLQAAAVVFLACGGAAIGRLSAGASLLPSAWVAERADELPHVDRGPLPAPLGVGVLPSGETLLPEFASVDEAVVALRRYEVAYQHAAAYLADHDSTTRVDDPDAYRARLVALDRAGRAMSEALREAPYDPVINGYYLTTLGQRQATLRQLDTALPSGHRIRSF
ncbi:MAG: hypothetical protein ABR499_10625 [Gemmatimonadaceae bacterium]